MTEKGLASAIAGIGVEGVVGTSDPKFVNAMISYCYGCKNNMLKM